ncbi:hypothetical protein JOD24_000591 [Kroppenstedtia sanguinis]
MLPRDFMATGHYNLDGKVAPQALQFKRAEALD